MDVLFLLLKVILSIIAAVIVYGAIRPKGEGRRLREYAPNPGRKLPIIGHLHLLGSKEPLFRTFAAMADEHGPVFTFWLGMRRTIVVCGRDAARECFTVKDKALSNRPRYAAAEHLGYNYAMFGFAPKGNYWREMRKITTLELLSNQRLEALRHVPAAEVDASLKTLYTRWVKNGKRPVKVNMREWFGDLTFNNVVTMIAGKRYFGGCDDDVGDEKEAREFRRCIQEFFRLTGVFVPSDAVPFVKWLDLQGHVKAMKKAAAEMDSVVSKWVEEHRLKRASGKVAAAEGDFIHVLLSVLDDAKITTYDRETIMKATCLALVLGGTDTTGVTLTWALTLLINNPRVLKKLQEEQDRRVGKERNVNYADISNLPYLHATIKEVMRLYPAAPLSVPREATEDCEVAGFRVPAGTRVMFNLWKIQRDPEIWDEPEEFRPERFLSSRYEEADVRGQDFEYIPFGYGRRICPGISMALQVVHLVLARLLHAFDVENPSGLPVDMTEGFGLNLPRANPLEVMLTPKLPFSLYN